MDAARELTKLLERDAQLAARSGQKLLGCLWIRGQLSLGEAQGERQRDESLLRAIVEIAFQPPPLLVAGGYQAGPRRLQLPARLLVREGERDEPCERVEPLLCSGPEGVRRYQRRDDNAPQAARHRDRCRDEGADSVLLETRCELRPCLVIDPDRTSGLVHQMDRVPRHANGFADVDGARIRTSLGPPADADRLLAPRFIAEELHVMRAEQAPDLFGNEVEDLFGPPLAGNGERDAVEGSLFHFLPLAVGDITNDEEELVLSARYETALLVAQVALRVDVPLDRLELARLKCQLPRRHDPVNELSLHRIVIDARADLGLDRTQARARALLDIEKGPVGADSEH